MNKKYLSVILFGALMLGTTGTFTSCKDYDDDIANLQEQIDGQKSDLSSKLAAVESSIASLTSAQSAMQTDIANAQKAIQAAQASADEAAKAAAEAKAAATEAQANAIAEAKKQLEAAKTELTELIQKGDEATKAEIDKANVEIGKVQGAVEALQAWQGTTDATLKALQDADTALEASLADVEEELQDVANRVGKLETGLKAQEDALETYKTTHATEVSGINTRLNTLEEAVKKLAGLDPADLVSMKSDISDLESKVGALSNSIAEINENLNILYIAVYKGVTGVELVNGYCVETGKYYSTTRLELISDIAVQTYTFGTDKYGSTAIKHMPKDSNLEGAVSFVKGTRQRLTAQALLRISPANATIATSDIHLIDSKGNDLVELGLVEVTNVKAFDGTLGNGNATRSTATADKTGLVEVEFHVGPKADEAGYDFDGEFMDAITVNDKFGDGHAKYFAVQISQATTIPATSEGSETEEFKRNVVSAYTLDLAPDKNNNASELNFNLYKDINDPTNVADVYNRWSITDYNNVRSNIHSGAIEYEWKNSVQAALSYTNTYASNRDTRNDEDAYSVKAGETFYVDLSDICEQYNVKYFYIVLDRDFVNATGDQDSELAAWNSYESSIKGINKVYTVDDPTNAVAAMSIDIEYDDVIGFRVYAANADGTLVDPDGRAFYVQVGEPTATITVPTQDITATTNTALGMKSAFIPVAGLEGWNELLAAAGSGNVEITLNSLMTEAVRGDKGDIDNGTLIGHRGSGSEFILDNVFHVELYAQNIEGSTKTDVNPSAFISATDLKNVKYIKVVFNASANASARRLVDNHPYSGKMTFKIGTSGSDAGSTVTIGVMNLSAKKVLPTIPTGYSAKDKQVVDGKYLCYVLPATAQVAPADGKTDGRMDLTNSFNLFTTFTSWNSDGVAVYSTTVDPNYTFTFSGVTNSISKRTAAYEMTVDNSFIENGQDYATSVYYNFGLISYVYDEVTNQFVEKQWVPRIDSFRTEFRCIAHAEKFAWNGVKQQLTYNVPLLGAASPYKFTSINATSTYDNITYKGTFKDFWTNVNTIAGIWNLADLQNDIEVELITDANGQVNEYFVPSIDNVNGGEGIQFAVVARDITPQADVASTLHLTTTDVFGHKLEIRLPLTVHIDKAK
ncbi:hypothetical protein [uncultured Bacteroides sp.]|uniref:hypothetical protein n=1 Tax=uncultured Bacteroides sp. TaxID=162156 RepID=UPI00260B8582|nr:hypothetical protein [uncultured Bacteroides sp.]